MAIVIPYVLREICAAVIRRSSIELGENIPSRFAGKLKAAFLYPGELTGSLACGAAVGALKVR